MKGVNLAIFPLVRNDENYPFEAKYLLNEKEIQKSPRWGYKPHPCVTLYANLCGL